MEKELDAVLKRIKKPRKAAGVNEIPTEVWKTKKFDDIILRLFKGVYKQNTVEK